MKLLKINTETGMFIEDVILPGVPAITVGEQQIPDPQYISIPCDGRFYWPRWDGKQWVEGGEAPEPVEPEPTVTDYMIDLDYRLTMQELGL